MTATVRRAGLRSGWISEGSTPSGHRWFRRFPTWKQAYMHASYHARLVEHVPDIDALKFCDLEVARGPLFTIYNNFLDQCITIPNDELLPLIETLLAHHHTPRI